MIVSKIRYNQAIERLRFDKRMLIWKIKK